jgi:hypothetical protein
MVRRPIAWALFFAGLMLAAPWAVRQLLAAGVVDDPTLPKRLTMAIFGAFVAFSGNAMPKMLTPLASMRCDPGKVQEMQRFAGLTWVITGLAYALAFLLLPWSMAEPIAVLVLMFGTVAVAARVFGPKRFRPAR